MFPSDTVYGLCCDPDDPEAAARLYELKGRPPQQPSAVMFFGLGSLQTAMPELSPLQRGRARGPAAGPGHVVVANPARRFGPACGPDPGTIGLRVPLLGGALAALGAVGTPVMQSSANLSGGRDARVLSGVPASIRLGADLVIDGGELAGTPSTVLDLRELESEGRWRVLREGALEGQRDRAPAGPGPERTHMRSLAPASLDTAAATGALGWNGPPGNGQQNRRAPGHIVPHRLSRRAT